MTTKPITLQLPENLYEVYRQRAEVAHRSVEDEVLHTVAASAPPEGISPELAKEVEELKSFSDKALWKTARSRLSAKEAGKVRELNYKQQREGTDSLTPVERQTLDELLYQYGRRLLIRSQSMLLLKERGYDINKLLKVL